MSFPAFFLKGRRGRKVIGSTAASAQMAKSPRGSLNPIPIVLLLPLAWGTATGPADAAASCAPALQERRNGTVSYQLGQVWSGVRTGLGTAVVGNQILMAYYDAERWVTAAALDMTQREVCRVRLPSRFSGWDAHNSLTIAVAPDGTLHLAGNMHASPLFYARGKADDLQSLTVQPMLNRDEKRTTYPGFLYDDAGNLLFRYRSGGSGDGTWILNRWRNGSWERVGQLFANRDAGNRRISAYPTQFVQGPDGLRHVVVVWRRTPDAATNFAVTYARTRDFENWTGLDGRSRRGPLIPESMDRVDPDGEGAGFFNILNLVLAPDGAPVVIYRRYSSTGTNAVVAARPVNGRWTRREIAVSTKRTELKGYGSLGGPLPNVQMLAQEDGEVRLQIAFPPDERHRLRLDLATLETRQDTAPVSRSVAPRRLPEIARGMANVAMRSQPVIGPAQRELGVLQWFAQGPNGDRPRHCTTQAPQACDPPPSALHWTPRQER